MAACIFGLSLIRFGKVFVLWTDRHWAVAQ